MSRRSISTTERVRIAPDERGRGVQLSAERVQEIEDECLRLFRSGLTQNQIVQEIGACRSRVSRWLNRAIKREGVHEEQHLLNTRTKTEMQRLFDRIAFQDPARCWSWLGGKRPNGYGTFHADAGVVTVHRFVYETFVAAIPDGHEIDHQCNNRSCVNPRHLRPVWPNQNMKLSYQRGRGDEE